jgi:hypothetical protein
MRTGFIFMVLLWGAAATPGAEQLYAIGSGVGDRSSKFYRIDDYDTAPRAAYLGECGITVFDIAFDSITRQFVVVDYSSTLYRLNPAHGSLSIIGTTGISRLNALEFGLSGNLYSWGSGSAELYRLDPGSGAVTVVGDTGWTSGGDLALDTNGTLYGSTGTNLIVIDPVTGKGSSLGAFGVSGVFGLEIDVDGRMLAAVGQEDQGRAELYWVDKTTGVATLIGPIAGAQDFGIYGLAFSGSPVRPKPVVPLAFQAVEIAWPTETNRWYQPQWATSLEVDQWIDLGQPIQGNGSEFSLFQSARHGEKKFFRIVPLN